MMDDIIYVMGNFWVTDYLFSREVNCFESRDSKHVGNSGLSSFIVSEGQYHPDMFLR